MNRQSTTRCSNALVLGLGESGDAAARLLAGEGARVTVVDSGRGEETLRRAGALERLGISALAGCGGGLPEGRFDVCVVSPGIRCDSGWVREAQARGLETVSELEFAWRRRMFRILAVTGSNGKSTLSKLCAESLEHAGKRIAIGGNYGEPLSGIVLRCREKRGEPPPDWAVVEVSSFQLELVSGFRPEVGILLNLNPNHLDRHGSMEEYARLKWRLFSRTEAGDVGVVPLGAAAGSFAAGPGDGAPGCRWVSFGTDDKADCFYREGRIVCRSVGGAAAAEAPLAGTVFDNPVLGVTAAAAAAAMRGCGADADCVARAARSFKPLPHRTQRIAEIRGVEFVDDSKATNLAAMCAAIRMTSRPVRLIAGGRLKEGDLSYVKDLLAKRVIKAYLVGEAKEALASAWGNAIPCALCSDLAGAVAQAWKEANRGEVILLSPACTSFDQFRNFEERGERFSELIQSIAEKERER